MSPSSLGLGHRTDKEKADTVETLRLAWRSSSFAELIGGARSFIIQSEELWQVSVTSM